MTPIPIPQINNLYISTASAHMIAMQFKEATATNVWDLPVLIPIIIAVLSLIAAIMSAVSVWKANNLAKSLQSSEVLKLFFDIMKELPMDGRQPLSVDQKQYVCNYFEFVCFSILKKKLSNDEIELVSGVMIMPIFIDFMLDCRRSRNGDGSFKYYFEWYHEYTRRHR